jgi:hypothetical protein
MKVGKIVELTDATGYSPTLTGISFTDSEGARCHISAKMIVRFYEALKYHLEYSVPELNWENYCNSLFENKK